jgi:ABC-type nitrate/sulfonate/bicarbonate transport system substrate-binding protein
MRQLLSGFLTLIAIVIAPECHAEQLDVVRVGVLRSSLFTSIQGIAHDGGYYQKNGLDLHETDFRSGNGSDGAQSVMRGQLDIYIGTLAEVTRINGQAIATGGKPPLVTVAAGNPGAPCLVLRNDIPYHSLTDLKGLRIAVSSLGTGSLIPFRYLLQTQHQTTDSLGIQLVAIGGSDMPPALLSKQIDGLLHSEMTCATAMLKAGGKSVLSRSEFGIAATVPAVGIIVERTWASGHRAVVQHVVDALEQASRDYEKMPREKVIQSFQNFIHGQPDVLALAYTMVDPRLYDLHEMADAHFNIAVAAMRQRGEVTVDLKPADVFDFSYSHIDLRLAQQTH